MTYSGITRICISTENVEQSSAFYCKYMRFAEIARGSLDRDSVKKLYKLDDSAAEYRMLKNSEQDCILQLIQFEKNTGRCIRDTANPWDYGYLDIAIQSSDNMKACLDFTAMGYKFFSTPAHYCADWINMDVSEGVMFGPDKLPIAMIQRLKEPIPKIDGYFGNMTDCAQVMRDMDQALKFYGNILGRKLIFDDTMPDGLVDPVVQVPYGTHSRLAMFLTPGYPVVELIHYSIEGTSLKDTARPENLGIFATCFKTDDLDGTLEVCSSSGFDVIREPVVHELAPYGKIRSAWVNGPSDTIVEFFQTL